MPLLPTGTPVNEWGSMCPVIAGALMYGAWYLKSAAIGPMGLGGLRT